MPAEVNNKQFLWIFIEICRPKTGWLLENIQNNATPGPVEIMQWYVCPTMLALLYVQVVMQHSNQIFQVSV